MDIIKRLLTRTDYADREEAAGEIERLRARIAVLEEALTEDDLEFGLRCIENRDDQANTYALDRARAALARGDAK